MSLREKQANKISRRNGMHLNRQLLPTETNFGINKQQKKTLAERELEERGQCRKNENASNDMEKEVDCRKICRSKGQCLLTK